jgi:hypothetical protein
MRRKHISLFELALLEAQGYITIYCMLDPSTVPNVPGKIPEYYNNFQNLLLKYPRIPCDRILDFIGCEYASDIEVRSKDDSGAITWILLYAKDKLKLQDRERAELSGKYVYVLTNEAYPNLCKVGKAVNPETRINGINSAGTVSEWVLRFALPVTNDYKVENLVHRHLQEFRRDSDQGHSREFFEVDFETAVKAVEYFGKDFYAGESIIY